MGTNEFLQLIQTLKEDRNREFKSSVPWQEKAFKSKIVKSILGMSNIRDGGHIIFGISQDSKSGFQLAGMEEGHAETYGEDEIASFAAEYADPFVRIHLDKMSYDGKMFVVLRVFEFEEIPVLCRKDGPEVNRGILYTRSTRIPETVSVPSQTEMREILEMAAAKQVRKFFRMQVAAGMTSRPEQTSAESFRMQREDLE